jgi:hypothetical protein
MNRIKWPLIACVLLISGCGVEHHVPMTNEQIIAEVRKCEKAGLSGHSYLNLDFRTFAIECRAKQ